MKSKNTVSNKSASNRKGCKGGPKGPRTILTIKQLREKLLMAAMVKEARKIDKKLIRLDRLKISLRDRLDAADRQVQALAAVRDEYREYAVDSLIELDDLIPEFIDSAVGAYGTVDSLIEEERRA